MDIEQGVDGSHHQKEQGKAQQQFQTFHTSEEQIIGRTAQKTCRQIDRMLDHHAKTDGSQKKYKIHNRMTLGKCICAHLHLLLSKAKEKSP
jgi:hypothetical protein